MELIAPFLKKVRSLSKAEQAALKRAVGTTLQNADANALAAFYRCIPTGVPWHQEDRWYAVACFQCLWRDSPEDGKPLEQIIATMVESNILTESTLKRLEKLLETRWYADGYMLTKLAHLLKLIHQKSSNAAIDFSALLEDLIYWNAQNQRVQKKWARTIFGAARKNASSGKNTEN